MKGDFKILTVSLDELLVTIDTILSYSCKYFFLE